jgi:hypothetical protein
MQFKDVFRWQTTSSQPVVVDDITLTLQSRVVSLHLPTGGFVWSRPTVVLVGRNGQAVSLPIVDTTRLLQLGIFGLSLAITLTIVRLVTFTQRKKKVS